MEATVNGAGPSIEHDVVLEDSIEEHVRGLEALLAPVGLEVLELEARLAELREREQRIESAIAALTEPPRGRKTAAATAAAKETRERGKREWVPSAQTQEKVLALLVASDEPMTVSMLSEKIETSRGTIEKALRVLRENHKVRMAGVASTPGGAKLYAPMPS